MVQIQERWVSLVRCVKNRWNKKLETFWDMNVHTCMAIYGNHKRVGMCAAGATEVVPGNVMLKSSPRAIFSVLWILCPVWFLGMTKQTAPNGC